MTIEQIKLDQTCLLLTFSGDERDNITVLTDKVNELSLLMKNKQATKKDKDLYRSIKWILKYIGMVEKEDLIRL